MAFRLGRLGSAMLESSARARQLPQELPSCIAFAPSLSQRSLWANQRSYATNPKPTPEGESDPNRPASVDPKFQGPDSPPSAPEPTPPPLQPSESSTSPSSVPAKAQPSLAQQYLDLNPDAAPSEEESETTKARSTRDKPSLSSIEKQRRMYSRIAGVSLVVGGLVGAWVLGREWDSAREKELLGRGLENEGVGGGFNGRFLRAKARGLDMLDYFNKPAFDPLLPPPLPQGYQHPYTLVIDLDDLLTHATWTREHGWRTAKRPGVDYFLGYLSRWYEIVIFTTQPFYTAMPVIEKLDPMEAYIPFKLFRESTRYYNKALVKDLSYLNRDLSKVVMIDTNPDHAQLQPENAIVMSPWKGDRKDKDLVGLIPFLEAIAIRQAPDVRPILERYKGKHIPSEYARVEAEVKRKTLEAWEEKQKKKTEQPASGWLSGILKGLGMANASAALASPPKTLIDLEREHAQKEYEAQMKYLAEHGEELKKAMQEDKDRQLKEMKSSLLGFLGGSAKPPGPPGEKPAEAAPSS